MRQIILMRHAQSYHNVLQRDLKAKFLQNYKKTPEFLQSIKDPSLKDRSITEKGMHDAQQSAQFINWDSIGIILVSPMRRCMETCRAIVKKSKSNAEVVIEPLLKGRLNQIWGYGGQIVELKKEYPEFNFGSFERFNIKSEIPWYIQMMPKQKQEEYKKIIEQNGQMCPKFKQDSFTFNKRIAELKDVIDFYDKKLSLDKNILIISHSEILSIMTAKQFQQNGRYVKRIQFDNVRPQIFPYVELFSWKTQQKKAT